MTFEEIKKAYEENNDVVFLNSLHESVKVLNIINNRYAVVQRILAESPYILSIGSSILMIDTWTIKNTKVKKTFWKWVDIKSRFEPPHFYDEKAEYIQSGFKKLEYTATEFEVEA